MVSNRHGARSGPLPVVCLTVVLLLPFLGRAFHIDDPLFLWTAEQIQRDPIDFYGFDVNWYGTESPMAQVMKNPPLASYYIALVSALLGLSEFSLHLAFLLFPIAVVLGTYRLAAELGSRPAVASLSAALTPAFLLSSTTVMCDLMMLSFWVWAVVFWLRGIKKDASIPLALSAVLICASSLTKYYGLSLVPLLFVYSWTKRRRLGLWVLFLVIPLVVLALYDCATRWLYGFGLLWEAFTYAHDKRSLNTVSFLGRMLRSFSFVGGCTTTALFFFPLLWSRRAVLAWSALAISIMAAIALVPAMGKVTFAHAEQIPWMSVAQVSLFIVAGMSLIVLTVLELLHGRDSTSVLLSLWVVGTFVFAGYLNWTLNARSILPMAPAVGVILIRRIERSLGPWRSGDWSKAAIPLALSAVVSLMVTWGDFAWAKRGRLAAKYVAAEYAASGVRRWFQGHWGFQYYMQKSGAEPIDGFRSRLAPGDIVVIPRYVTNYVPIPKDRIKPVRRIRLGSQGWLATMDGGLGGLGAGFHRSAGHPLPFAFGRARADVYRVVVVVTPIWYQARSSKGSS